MRHQTRSSAIGALLVSLLFLTAAFLGCETESEDIPSGAPITVEGLINDGWEGYMSGDYDVAITCFSDAAGAEAYNLEAYLGLGYAFAQRNDLTRARQNMSNVIGLCPVLVEEGLLTQEHSDHLLAEAYAGMATAYLAERSYDSSVENADYCLEIDPQFSHRWIPGFGADEVKLAKAEAYFGAAKYAESMFVIDEMTGEFIDQSAQVEEAVDTLIVQPTPDSWRNGRATLTLTRQNLVYPSRVINMGLLDESFANYSFESWTDDDPDAWSVFNEQAGVREINETRFDQGYGGEGTDACNFYNQPNSGGLLTMSASSLPAPEKYVRLKIDVSFYRFGELRLFNGDDMVKTLRSGGVKVIDFTTSDSDLLKIVAPDSTDITVAEISCREFENEFEQEIVDYSGGGNTVTIFANPVPEVWGSYIVEYIYATDFGAFLIELRDAIDELRE